MFALSAPDSPFMSISTRQSLWHVIINYTCCNHGKMNSLILWGKLFVIVCSSQSSIWRNPHSRNNFAIPFASCDPENTRINQRSHHNYRLEFFRFLGLFEGEISAPRNHRNNVSRCQWKHLTHRRYSNESWIKESREAGLGCCGRRKGMLRGCMLSEERVYLTLPSEWRGNMGLM